LHGIAPFFVGNVVSVCRIAPEQYNFRDSELKKEIPVQSQPKALVIVKAYAHQGPMN
jgi:hypothetical protein